jgi:hypothetical protein
MREPEKRCGTCEHFPGTHVVGYCKEANGWVCRMTYCERWRKKDSSSLPSRPKKRTDTRTKGARDESERSKPEKDR